MFFFPPAPPTPFFVPQTQADTGLEYDRYLREVVSILEEDEKFREKLANTSIDDIKTGAIAHQLEYVSHHIRTKLDELKRREVGRLRELARQKRAMDNMGKVAANDKLFPNHLDHSNPHTFETEDLKRLIKEATRDLEEQDKVRKEEFKRYVAFLEHLCIGSKWIGLVFVTDNAVALRPEIVPMTVSFPLFLWQIRNGERAP